MKKVLLTSCIAAMSAAASANVYLPRIGIDGWDSDSQYFRGAAFNQGYLTTSGVKNHTINPAFALDRMETAEARMHFSSAFSGGVFTRVSGQNLGLFFGRRTFDDDLYRYDSDGDGEVEYDPNNKDDGYFFGSTTSNIMDAYWAAKLGAGDLGVRLNYRAIGDSDKIDLQNENTRINSSSLLMEFNTTVGFVSNSMPLEATATLGLPLGSFESVSENTALDTKSVTKKDFDKGLRWGATTKYTLLDGGSSTTVLSAFMGSTGANYRTATKSTTGNTTTTTEDQTYIQERFAWGVVGSQERIINNRTRLVASAGLTRTSSKIGKVNNNPDPSEPNYDRNVSYELPVAVGVEFRKSERTDFIGSVSGNLFNSSSNTDYDNDGGDAAKEEDSSSTWDRPDTIVQFGVAYEMTPRLQTNFVIDKGLFVNGLTSGLATRAEFTYKF